MKVLRYLFYILLALGVAFFIWLVLPETGKKAGEDIPDRVGSTVNPRNRFDADNPRAVSEEDFDSRFIILSAIDRAGIPVVDRFDSPVGSEEGAFCYDAQPFGSDNEKRGGKHGGQDLNGIGGENTDEGDPVYASGRGMVVYTGKPSDDWGNVVVLAHRLPNGEIIQTLYAHLRKSDVILRQIVSRGKKIGEIGSANGLYWAHLHYEAMSSSFNCAGEPGYFQQPANRFDPEELNKKIGNEFISSQKNDIFSTLERLEVERNRSMIQFEMNPRALSVPQNRENETAQPSKL